jgi:hypothetical protein
MGNRYWFKPKIFGYGATPTTWDGWAVTVGYCGVIALATLAAILLIEWQGVAKAMLWALWGVWGFVLVAATAVLVVVSKRRTDGEWRWRWGRRLGSSLREQSKV